MNEDKQFPGHAIIISAAADLGGRIDKDADAIERTLLDPSRCSYSPDRIARIKGKDATIVGVTKALSKLTFANEDEPVLLYFSGHGYENPATGETGLCLTDDLLSAARFGQLWAALPAKRKVIVLDSCYAGGMPAVKNATGGETVKGRSLDVGLLNVGQGSVVMASSKSDQTSLLLANDDLSLFTKHLVDGLRGAAGHDEDGYITLFNLFAHVRVGVSGECTDQTPILSANELTEDLRLAYCSDENKRKSAESENDVPEDPWKALSTVLSTLYPGGPTHDDLWLRADGDPARITLTGPGRTQWRSALRMLRLGGGGDDLTAKKLIYEALDDYKGYAGLQVLADVNWPD